MHNLKKTILKHIESLDGDSATNKAGFALVKFKSHLFLVIPLYKRVAECNYELILRTIRSEIMSSDKFIDNNIYYNSDYLKMPLSELDKLVAEIVQICLDKGLFTIEIYTQL